MLSKRVVLALLAVVSLSLLSFSLNSSMAFETVNETYSTEGIIYSFFLKNLFLFKLIGIVIASVLGFQFGRLHFWANTGVLMALFSALLFRNFESTFLLIPIPIGIGMVYPMVYYELFASASTQKLLFARAGFLFLAQSLGSFLGGMIMNVVFSFFDLGNNASSSAPTHFFTVMMFFFIPVIICSGLLVRNAPPSIAVKSIDKRTMNYAVPLWMCISLLGALIFVKGVNYVPFERSVGIRPGLYSFQYILSGLITLGLALIFILGDLRLGNIFGLLWKAFLVYIGLVAIEWIALWVGLDVAVYVDLVTGLIWGPLRMAIVAIVLVSIFSYLTPRYYILGVAGFFVARDAYSFINLSGNANALLGLLGLVILIFAFFELKKHNLREVVRPTDDEVDMINSELRS